MYQQQPTNASPARPLVVTLAAVILGLIALFSLINAIIGLAAMGEAVREFRRLASSEPLDAGQVDSIVSFLRFSFICNAVVAVAFAVLLGVLAMGLARGNRPARVVTWVVCGLGLLCACCNGFGSIASFGTMSPSSTDPDQIAGNLLVRSLPDWAAGLLLGSSALSVLGYIATAVLLALPAANAFFKGQRPAGWSPPMYPQNPPNYPPPPPPPPSDQ